MALLLALLLDHTVFLQLPFQGLPPRLRPSRFLHAKLKL